MARKRLTVDLDDHLLRAVDELATATGCSRNQVIAEALQERVARHAREEVDSRFEAMSNDVDYIAELRRIEQEAASATDAAWSLLDRSESRARKAAAATRRGVARAAR